ncbi:hypothetical protein [Amphritea sp. HPY]|uniref:hypothetical protein n=1 Tax=Amphritea sp. HPY TaxID=3421652 RepID=UPI003D7EF035
MTDDKATKTPEETIDLEESWDDSGNDVELDAKEKKYCCDAEKRRRIEALREQQELKHELREFYDD